MRQPPKTRIRLVFLGEAMFGRIFTKLNSIIALPIAGVLIGAAPYLYNEYKENLSKEKAEAKELKREKIQEIDEKLKFYYYPLQAYFLASEKEWHAFRQKYGNNRKAYFSSEAITIDGVLRYLRDCAPSEPWKVAISVEETPAKKSKINGKLENSDTREYTMDEFSKKVTTKYCIVSDKEVDAWVSHITAQYDASHGEVENIIMKNRHLIKDDKEMIQGTELLMLHITGYRDVIKRWENGDRSVMTSHVNFPSRLPIVVNDRISKLEDEMEKLRH